MDANDLVVEVSLNKDIRKSIQLNDCKHVRYNSILQRQIRLIKPAKFIRS